MTGGIHGYLGGDRISAAELHAVADPAHQRGPRAVALRRGGWGLAQSPDPRGGSGHGLSVPRRAGIACVAQGTVQGAELRRSLTGQGYTLGEGLAALVLAAYHRYGDDAAHRLPGPATIAIIDTRHTPAAVKLWRDHDAPPLHYYRTRSCRGFRFAATPHALSRFPDYPDRLVPKPCPPPFAHHTPAGEGDRRTRRTLTFQPSHPFEIQTLATPDL